MFIMAFLNVLFTFLVNSLLEIRKKALPLQKPFRGSMKLIIETGSFGTEWAIISDRKIVAEAQTEVINPYFQSRREISRLVRLNLPNSFFHKKYEKVYFYGSRCGTEERKKKVEQSLISQFKAHVMVDSTLLAASRGILHEDQGIACVLGNHSGSCHYDGTKITEKVLSGGYLLGDEGSSIVLGRMFLSDVVKSMGPADLTVDFYEHFSVSPNKLQDMVYELKEPDLFMADVAIFLKEHKEHQYVKDLVMRNFKSFFVRCVMQYDYKNLPICAVGHMAHDFKDILEEVAMKYGSHLVKAVELTPMHGLLKYHLKHPEV